MNKQMKQHLEAVIDATVENNTEALKAAFSEYVRAKSQAILLGEEADDEDKKDDKEDKEDKKVDADLKKVEDDVKKTKKDQKKDEECDSLEEDTHLEGGKKSKWAADPKDHFKSSTEKTVDAVKKVVKKDEK